MKDKHHMHYAESDLSILEKALSGLNQDEIDALAKLVLDDARSSTTQVEPTEIFPRGPNGERYFLKAGSPGSNWTEVNKAEWIKAERQAGFRPKMARDDPRYMETCVTAGFGSSHGVSGTITYNGTEPTH